jgi:hypothetical protein
MSQPVVESRITLRGAVLAKPLKETLMYIGKYLFSNTIGLMDLDCHHYEVSIIIFLLRRISAAAQILLIKEFPSREKGNSRSNCSSSYYMRFTIMIVP